MILGHGYYLVRFSNEIDWERVLLEGPWIVLGHYLTVSRWTPFFTASEAMLESTLAWIRFFDLFLMFYDEDVLYATASAIGQLVKVDVNTGLVTSGRFARDCVEIDLTKPLATKFWLDGRWHLAEYEGLHIIYFACGRYGHR